MPGAVAAVQAVDSCRVTTPEFYLPVASSYYLRRDYWEVNRFVDSVINLSRRLQMMAPMVEDYQLLSASRRQRGQYRHALSIMDSVHLYHHRLNSQALHKTAQDITTCLNNGCYIRQ